MPQYSRLLLLLPGWIAFMVYLPALQNGFVWDDTYFLSDLPYLRDAALWWRHIGEPLFVSPNYFRPLPLLSFVLESRIEPLSPFVFHLSNLLLHVSNTTLVVLLGRRLIAADDRGRNWRPALAGLLFALHPALIETVSWISDRFDLMMGAFLLLALLADAALRSRMFRAGACGILFLLALLCKETAIVLLALLPLWQAARLARDDASWCAQWRSLVRDAWPTWFALSAALLVYLALRHEVLEVFYRRDTLIVSGSLLQHALLVAKTLAWYGLLLCWPFGNIGPVHPAATPVALTDPWAWFGVFLVVITAAALVLAFRRRRQTGLLGCAALLALAPVANLVPLTIGDNLVHDRYLLLPLVFAALALASTRSIRWRASTATATGLWVALSLTTIFLTVPRWQNNLSLWGWAYALEPESRIAGGNYLAALANAGYNQSALALSDKILRTHPTDANALHDKALTLMRLGRREEARKYNGLALEHFKRDDAKGRLDASEAWNLRGYLFMQDGDWDEAAGAFEQAIRITPYLTRPHFNLALVHYQRGDIEAGDREMAFTLRHDPPELVAEHRRQAESARAAALAQTAGK